MHNEVLSPQTQNLLSSINKDTLPDDTYLGGGTAIALQVGHRKSEYLDFFTKSEFVEGQWEQKLEKEFDFKLIKKDWQTLIGEIGGAKFSLFGYKYGPIRPLLDYKSIKLASLEDLSAMKLDTTIARGSKRDFIDIYFLAKKYSLEKLFEFYQEKYGNFEEKEIMIKKSLIYFEDADKDEMPELLEEAGWESVKEWFLKRIDKI